MKEFNGVFQEVVFAISERRDGNLKVFREFFFGAILLNLSKVASKTMSF